MSDDLATFQYRTAGRQKAPLIVRTRGHRLEGIWHSGSPMGGILNLLRGVHVSCSSKYDQSSRISIILCWKAMNPLLLLNLLMDTD